MYYFDYFDIEDDIKAYTIEEEKELNQLLYGLVELLL